MDLVTPSLIVVEIARTNLFLRSRDLKCRGLGKIQDRPVELESSLAPTKWLMTSWEQGGNASFSRLSFDRSYALQAGLRDQRERFKIHRHGIPVRKRADLVIY